MKPLTLRHCLRSCAITIPLTVVLLAAYAEPVYSQASCDEHGQESVSDTPIALVMPFASGTQWIVGEPGSFYNERAHKGRDFYATDWNIVGGPFKDQGEPVFPLAAGAIKNFGFDKKDFGWFVIVEHADPSSPDNPLRTRYAHLEDSAENYVDEGDLVTIRTQIGRVGSTGNSTGPHLHLSFQIWEDGEWKAGPKPSPMWTTSGLLTLCDGQTYTVDKNLPGPEGVQVTWKEVVGVEVSGNSLEKEVGSAGDNAGASSYQAIKSGDGAVEFTTAENTTHKMAGLSHGDDNQSLWDIDYHFWLADDGWAWAHESGYGQANCGRYAAGTVFRIEVADGEVRWLKDGVPCHSNAPRVLNYPLSVDTTLDSIGATIDDVVLEDGICETNCRLGCGGAPDGCGGTCPPTSACNDVTWKNVSGVIPTGNNLSKDVGSDGDNAGAASMESIPSGAGSVEFTTAENTTHKMAGLSHGDDNQSLWDIDYHFWLADDGWAWAHESGYGQANCGRYAAGTVFRIEVGHDRKVRYYKDGWPCFTSRTRPTYPLLVDTTLDSVGATIKNVRTRNARCERRCFSGCGGEADGCGGTCPPTGACDAISWMNVSGVTATENNLAKDNGWDGHNAGAASVQFVSAGQYGFVEFSCGENNKSKIAGISNGDIGRDIWDIDYNIWMGSDGWAWAHESGISKASCGRYSAGTVFRIEVSNDGKVRYYKNGSLCFTSQTPPTYPLLVDTTLDSVGATIQKVYKLSF